MNNNVTLIRARPAHLYFNCTAADGSYSLAHKVYIHLSGIFLQLGKHLDNTDPRKYLAQALIKTNVKC